MTKYKCPDCGKISTSMYCDTCEKSIPSSCAIDSTMGSEEAVANELKELKEYTKRNNYLLSEVERHTKMTAVIMVISAICAAASAVFMLIGFIL